MARPLTGTTLALTDTGTTALVVGGAVGATAGTGTILSGPIKIASATPSDTSMKLYNISGTLTWNGTTLAAGSSVSGTTGKLAKFTSSNSVGDSIVAESGTIITVTGTLNATTAIQLNGTSINTGATLSNVAYLDQVNIFSNASGQKFAAGIGIDGGVPSTHGIMMPTGVPGVTTTTLYNNSGVLTWPATGMSLAGTLAVTGVATFTAQPILSSLTASQAVFSDASKGLVSNAITGSGNVVMSASPTLTGTIGAAAMTLSSTLGVTGLITSTGGITGGASSHTTGTFSSTLGVTGLITSTGGITGGASSHTTGTFSSTLGVTGLITSSGGITGGAASHTSGAFSTTLAVTGAATFSADSSIAATKKFYLDGGGDTYIYEVSANLLTTYVGGKQMFTLDYSGGTNSYAYVTASNLIIDPAKKFYLDGGGDTYFVEGTANRVFGYVGGQVILDMQNDGATRAAGFNTTNAYINSTYKFYFDGGGDTYGVESAANQLDFIAGGSGGVRLSSGATSWAAISDEQMKTDMVPMVNALDKIGTLRTVVGRYNTDDVDQRHPFLIAQDVQAVLPEAVTTVDDGTLVLRYDDVIPLLTAALKEAKARIEALELKASIDPPSKVVESIAERKAAVARKEAKEKARNDAEKIAACEANNLELTQEP